MTVRDGLASTLGKLFSPARFGERTLRNRVAMAPMTRCQSPGHVPNERNVEYYRRRAAGGVGLIITEGTTVGHAAANGYPDVPAFHGAEALAGWRAVADAVHAEGAAIIPQLWHVGSVRQPGMQPDAAIPGHGPSAVVHPSLDSSSAVPPVMMSEHDICEVVNAFGVAARAAKDAGFDGVELHGAHGYLIDQFFWTKTNLRRDAYNGDIVQRTRFATQVVRAVRENVGPQFPVAFRLSQFKLGDYPYRIASSPEQLEAWLAPLVDAGVDVFHCSTRRFDDPEFEGSPLNLAGWVRKISGKATITVGSVGLDSDFIAAFSGQPAGVRGVEHLLERLERDEFDFVAVGRALLADAEWANKLRTGRYSDVTAFKTEHLTRYP